MARTKVTSRFEIITLLDGFANADLISELGETVVTEAKQLIANGQSPQRGENRFEKYSDSYTKDIKGSLGKKYGKNVRPVNLHLSGDMMDGYGWRRKSAMSIEVGIVSGSSKSKEIAGYHQDGTPKMPARKVVPDEGEEWSVKIMRAIREIYGNRLEKLIRQSNKKR